MKKVFESSSIGTMRLKNRIIRSATHEGLGDGTGRPLPELAKVYERLARGGVGAIITGYVGVQADGRTMKTMRMFDRDELIEPYRPINRMAQQYEVPVIAQLAHGGGQVGRGVTGKEAVAPSAGRYPLFSNSARELSEAEIKEIIDSFVKAIARAREAGFSGVQLHAATGYLLAEFLSPATNRRTDRWGGSTENRFRILAEIASRTREEVGSYPLLVKFSSYDGDRNGMRLDEGVRYAEMFQKAGYDAVEVTCGGSYDGFNSMRVTRVPVDAYLGLIPFMKKFPPSKKMMMKALAPLKIKRHKPLFNYNVAAAAEIRKHVDIPVIAVGGIRSLNDIEEFIGSGAADYAAMCRPFIIEPDIVNKFKNGAQNDSKCINCGYCVIGVYENPLRCYHGRVPSTKGM